MKIAFFLFACAVCVRAETPQAETFIGTNAIPFAVIAETQSSFDTNWLANEFTAYFEASPDIGQFFRTNRLSSSPSVQIDPAGHDGGPPREVASAIRYFGPPNERIVVGEGALEWLLNQIEAAAPFTNTWSQADSFLAALRSCAITNDLQTCRESFLIEGFICTNETEDAQMVAGIASYWSRLRYSSPNVLGFRTGRIVENGPELPALFCRCTDPQSRSGSLSSVVLVYFDNRWRMILQ